MHYYYIAHGYKMVGAVPVNFAQIIGEQIYRDIKEYLATGSCGNLRDTSLAQQLTLLTPDLKEKG